RAARLARAHTQHPATGGAPPPSTLPTMPRRGLRTTATAYAHILAAHTDSLDRHSAPPERRKAPRRRLGRAPWAADATLQTPPRRWEPTRIDKHREHLPVRIGTCRYGPGPESPGRRNSDSGPVLRG